MMDVRRVVLIEQDVPSVKVVEPLANKGPLDKIVVPI